MTDDDLADRINALEQENARLRGLLDQREPLNQRELPDQRELPATLRHQIRNTLGTLRIIMRRSAENSDSVENYAAHLEGRFDALLRAQTLLIAGADKGADLYALIANELVAHTLHPGERSFIDGPAIRFPPKAAELLALAVHELVTNAIKFGAGSRPDGKLVISWRVTADEPQQLILEWEETGLTGVEPVPRSPGFGMQALEHMLCHQLKANLKLDFRPSGLQCVITIPMEVISRKPGRGSEGPQAPLPVPQG